MSWADTSRNEKYEVNHDREVRNKKSGRILTGGINNRGYRTVHLNHSDPPEFVHRIVAETFIVNDDPIHKTDVNHIDGNKLNNHVSNLEWVSRSDNVKHAYVNGLNRPSGGGSNKRAVRVVETGEIYDSQYECAKAIGGSAAGLSLYLNDARKKDTYKGYHLQLM